jgi:hypothetical protein
MSPGARKESNGGGIPNLPVPGGGTILVYLQGGNYSRKVEIVGTSGSYSFGPREKFKSTSKAASGQPSGRSEEVSRRPPMFEQFSRRKLQRLGVRTAVRTTQRTQPTKSTCSHKCQDANAITTNGEVLMLASER